MNHRPQRWLPAVVFFAGTAFGSDAGEAPAALRGMPLPRPRLTEVLRAKVESERPEGAGEAAMKMEKVIVREPRLPVGPPKEEQREGPFSLTQGGYLLQKRGERFSTEIGLWRHIDIMEEPTDALRQSVRIRMGFLRFSW